MDAIWLMVNYFIGCKFYSYYMSILTGAPLSSVQVLLFCVHMVNPSASRMFSTCATYDSPVPRGPLGKEIIFSTVFSHWQLSSVLLMLPSKCIQIIKAT